MAKRRAQQTALFAEEQRARPVSPQARAMTVSRSRNKREAPAPKPWQAVILAVDTAAHSGWSNWFDGKYQCSGEIDTEHQVSLEALCMSVVANAKAYGRTPLLVLEFWWGGNARVCAGLHVHCDRWKRAWKAAGQSPRRVVKVQPGQWRSAVLGSWSIGKRSAEVRRAEQSIARGIACREDVGEDEAPAICIGHWSSYAAKVGEVLGERVQKKSMAAWQRREVRT
jgi:hypothetical protein